MVVFFRATTLALAILVSQDTFVKVIILVVFLVHVRTIAPAQQH